MKTANGRGHRLRVLLALADIDQMALAAAVGVSQSTISRYIRGERELSQQTERELFEYLLRLCMGSDRR